MLRRHWTEATSKFAALVKLKVSLVPFLFWYNFFDLEITELKLLKMPGTSTKFLGNQTLNITVKNICLSYGFGVCPGNGDKTQLSH
jgi:hypothetical protein